MDWGFLNNFFLSMRQKGKKRLIFEHPCLFVWVFFAYNSFAQESIICLFTKIYSNVNLKFGMKIRNAI